MGASWPLGEEIEESVFDFAELRLERQVRAAQRCLQYATPEPEGGITQKFGRGTKIHLLRKEFVPGIDLVRMNSQADRGARRDLLQRHTDDPGQEQRVKLCFAVQNLAGNGQGQPDDLFFYPLVISLSLPREVP